MRNAFSTASGVSISASIRTRVVQPPSSSSVVSRRSTSSTSSGSLRLRQDDAVEAVRRAEHHRLEVAAEERRAHVVRPDRPRPCAPKSIVFSASTITSRERGPLNSYGQASSKSAITWSTGRLGRVLVQLHEVARVGELRSRDHEPAAVRRGRTRGLLESGEAPNVSCTGALDARGANRVPRRHSPSTREDDREPAPDLLRPGLPRGHGRAALRPLPRGLRGGRALPALAGQDRHGGRRPPLLPPDDEPPSPAHQRRLRRPEPAGPQRRGGAATSTRSRSACRSATSRARRSPTSPPRSSRHPAPVFHGDTLFAETEVLEITPSRSKPDRGVVRVRTDVLNQEGVLVTTFVRRVLVPRRPAEPTAAASTG